MEELNKKIFLWFYTNTQKSKAASNISIFVTNASRFLFSFVYSGYLIFLAVTRNGKIVPYIVFPVLTLLAAKWMRRTLKVKRPFSELEIKALVDHKTAYSFPSNHSATTVVIAAAVSYVDWRVAVVLFALAAITGISRIQTGIHYPFDVLAGFGLGLFFGCLGYPFI